MQVTCVEAALLKLICLQAKPREKKKWIKVRTGSSSDLQGHPSQWLWFRLSPWHRVVCTRCSVKKHCGYCALWLQKQ